MSEAITKTKIVLGLAIGALALGGCVPNKKSEQKATGTLSYDASSKQVALKIELDSSEVSQITKKHYLQGVKVVKTSEIYSSLKDIDLVSSDPGKGVGRSKDDTKSSDPSKGVGLAQVGLADPSKGVGRYVDAGQSSIEVLVDLEVLPSDIQDKLLNKDEYNLAPCQNLPHCGDQLEVELFLVEENLNLEAGSVKKLRASAAFGKVTK
jgi:hypothetical protein